MTLDTTDGVAVFTDGSCYYKDRSGGWAWLALDSKGNRVHKCGCASDTTNNRMELYAPMHALNWLHQNHGAIDVQVHCDSQYVVLGSISRSRKRKVNIDLWTALDIAADQHSYVEWNHVRGHSGHKHNEFVDKLASKARKERLNGN